MILALLATAVLATLAAAVRATGRVGGVGLVGGAFALAAFAAGALAPLPSPARGAAWLAGIALLGKTLALGRVSRRELRAPRGLAFLFVWPGWDPRRAFVPDRAVDRGAGRRSVFAGIVEVFAGLVLARGCARLGILDPAWPWLAAVARAGTFVLVFDGAFRAVEGAVAALGWRPDGVFREPWKLSDISDFWGERWNRFVGRTLALEVFAPARRRFGRAAAVLLTFFHSGVLHEALFRGAADGPDGRYVAFFLIQGLAVLATAADRPSVGGRILAWGVLLGASPLFFGGCYPRVAPFERILDGWF
jgi:hypothetical protein